MRANACWALPVAGALTFAGLPAFAQEPAAQVPAAQVPAQANNDAPVSEPPLTPEENAMLGNALVFDPATLAMPSNKPLRVPGLSGAAYDVTRTQNMDGSSSIVVKQPLQTDWSNSVGANLGPPNSGGVFGQPLPTTRDTTPSGAAWASLGVPNIGSLDARVDPSGEQGKVGTTLKQSIPFGGRFAVTLQNTYSVTEMLGQPSAGPADLPLMRLPSAPVGAAPHVFGNESSVRFNILPTGTTLGAGVTTASNDPVTHNIFSAEQKLYGPLQVTTAVTDFGQATSSKSITAGFKFHW